MNIYTQYLIRFTAMLALILPLFVHAATCTSDTVCDNGLHCDGKELCRPSQPDADSRGCVHGKAPSCSTVQHCDEIMNSCVTTCWDNDGDGHEDSACGGDDCDDSNPGRFPGKTELCDFDGQDEDCDNTTIGHMDSDGDGFDDYRCAGAQ